MKYNVYTLSLLVFMGCGSSQTASPKVVGGENTPSVIHVQLNAKQFQAPNGTESVILGDDRYMIVPSAIQVVGGAFQCHPSTPNCNNTVLRAQIVIDSVICSYETNNIAAAYIPLTNCSDYHVSYYLSAGATIELVPLYAPGLLLEAHFNLTR